MTGDGLTGDGMTGDGMITGGTGEIGTTLVDAGELTAFVQDALSRVGTRTQDAALVAEVLVAADLAGVDSHGVARLRRYVEGVRKGTIDAAARPRVQREHGAVCVVDAQNGLGQPALCLAVDLAVERARSHGVAAVAVRRSNHIGIAGWYAERAARAGMFALVTTNATPQVAPTGAAHPMFGTDPLSWALPSAQGPICFDAATSIVPRGKLERLQREGRPMRPGWALGPDGTTSVDLESVITGLKARAGYALLPLGGLGSEYSGHKGSGLGLMVELLCGPLAGASWSRHTYAAGPGDLGQFVICLDLGALDDADAVLGRVDALADELRGTTPVPGGPPVRLPGDRRRSSTAARTAGGVPLTAPVVRDLALLGVLTGATPPTGLPRPGGGPATFAASDDDGELIDLSSGQLREPLSTAARDAAAAALDDVSVTQYQPVPGLPRLRAVIAQHYSGRTGTPVDPVDVTVVPGARSGLSCVIRAIAADGEVLVPRPHWSHYPRLVELAGAVPVIVAGEAVNGWLPDPERLERATGPRTRAILINSPVNPTGTTYPPALLARLRSWALARGIRVIIDDVYWAYGDDGEGLSLDPTDVVVGGASKVQALAGLRIGWIRTPAELTRLIRDVVEHTVGPTSTLGQVVVAAVLSAPTAQQEVSARAGALAGLRAHALARLREVPVLRPVPAAGGIYICLDASDALAGGLLGAEDDQELCRRIEADAGVRLRAGSTFGMPGYLRLCVATTPAVLDQVAVRLTAWLQRARPDSTALTTIGGKTHDQRT